MNVFDLSARIGLNSDDYDKGLSNAESAFSKVASGIKNGIGTIAKVTAAGFTAAAAGITALSKQAVESYADYEQLVGGAKLMFGDAYDFIAEKSKEAYATVQMSTNDYLQQVNGFATGLKTSLGGDARAAAELADRIVTAEADVVAATGQSQESIQNAFNGIMKSNFMMLDNLQLGITPTKEGFQEVINKVNEWNSANGKATSYVIDNLADCQSALIDYIEMQGLSGYAANEAAETITGSLSMMKAAWSNLVTGVADDEADFDSLIDNLVTSVDAAAQNIIPRVEQALTGVGKLVEKLVPTIVERIPDLLENTLPVLSESALKLLRTLGQALVNNADQLLLYVWDLIDDIWVSISESSESSNGLSKFIEALAKRIPQILDEIETIAIQLVSGLGRALQDNQSISIMMDAFAQILYGIAESIAVGIPVLAETAFTIIKQLGEGIIENLPWLLEESVVLIEELADYIAEAAPRMMPQIVELVAKIAEILTNPDTLVKLLDAALKIIIALAEGLLYSLPELLKKIPVIIENLKKALIDAGPMLGKAAVELVGMLAAGLIEAIPAAVKAVMQIYDAIAETIISWGSGLFKAIGESWKQAWKALEPYLIFAKTWGNHLIENFISGIKQKWEDLKKSVSDVAQTVKDFLGFSEPKKGPLSNFHTYAPDMMDLYSKGIKENAGKLEASLQTSLEGVSEFFTPEKPQASSTAATNIFNINISSDAIASDYDAYRAAQKISEELGNLQRMQALAVGA